MLIKSCWRCWRSLPKWNDRWITYSPQAEPHCLAIMSDSRDQCFIAIKRPLRVAKRQLRDQVRKGKCVERHLGTWRGLRRVWLCFHSLSWCQCKASGYWKQVHKSAVTASPSAREGRTPSSIFKTSLSSWFVSFSVDTHFMTESDQMSVNILLWQHIGCTWTSVSNGLYVAFGPC